MFGGTPGSSALWSQSVAVNLTPGAHPLSVRARVAFGTSATVGDSVAANAGTLTVVGINN